MCPRERDRVHGIASNGISDLTDELDDPIWMGLLHVETRCFARYTQSAIDSADRVRVASCFEFARTAWLHGDGEVQNALGVSYIEHLNFVDGKAFRSWAFDQLPEVLREQARG